MNRLVILVLVIVGLILLMSNGAVFLLPDECDKHIGLLPPECIPEEHR